MPKDLTQKRLRRALSELRRRTRPVSPRRLRPLRADEGPPRIERDREEGPDDLDGGAGVREPRHPFPTMPAAALALEEPEPQYLDLTR